MRLWILAREIMGCDVIGVVSWGVIGVMVMRVIGYVMVIGEMCKVWSCYGAYGRLGVPPGRLKRSIFLENSLL